VALILGLGLAGFQSAVVALAAPFTASY